MFFNQDSILNEFSIRNPEINLIDFNWNDKSGVDKLNWNNPADQSDIIEHLKKYQRLLRIYPDWTIAYHLMNDSQNEICSAHQIAAMPEQEFIQKYGVIIGDKNIAKEMYQKAAGIKALVSHLWASTLNVTKASRYYSSMKASNISDSVSEHFQNIPSYEELFGNQNYYEDEESLSVFSPAAYLSDLLSIADKEISIRGDSMYALKNRRPDLLQIPLTNENTNNQISYLEIVNKILALKVNSFMKNPLPVTTPEEETKAVHGTYQFLAKEIYPFDLPFNLPLEEIRSYFQQFNTSLAVIYKTLNFNEKETAREYLLLSVEEYNLVTIPLINRSNISNAYGLTEPEWDKLYNLDVFLKQTELDRWKLQDLFYQNLSQEERKNGFAHHFYINQLLSENLFVSIENDSQKICNLNESVLDRIHRFLFLAKKLNWTYPDLDWVLSSIGVKDSRDIDEDCIKDIARMKQITEAFQITPGEACCFIADMKTMEAGNTGDSETVFETVFHNGEPLPENFLLSDISNKTKIASALGLSLDDLTMLSEALLENNNFNVINGSILYRHARLAGFLKLPVDQYLIFLDFLYEDHIPAVFTPQSILDILENIMYAASTGLSIYDFDYILNGTETKIIYNKYKEEDIQSFLKTTWAFNDASPSNLTDYEPSKKMLLNKLAAYLESSTDILETFFEIIDYLLELPEGYNSFAEVFLTPISDFLAADKQLNYIYNAIKLSSRFLLLNQKLQLNQTEINSMIQNPSCYFNNQSEKFICFLKLKSIFQWKQLKMAFDDTEDRFTVYFNACHSEDKILAEKLSSITGWKEKQILDLAALINCNLRTTDGMIHLKQVFDLCQYLGADVQFLYQLKDILTYTNIDDKQWNDSCMLAQSVRNMLNQKYNQDNQEGWDKISSNIDSSLNERKRSALSKYTLWKLHSIDKNICNLRTLSEYLLVDVEITGCAEISYIKQAILSTQMYLQRCRLNLETDIIKVNISEAEWEWIMNYRVWEASRKVFLYPENYIEPELRSNKTELFQELETELLQSEITEENVETAYHNYFEKFEEIANLQIMEAYCCTVDTPMNTDSKDTLFIFGKTASNPNAYYYCKYCKSSNNKNEKRVWNQWTKINLSINSDYISPVFAFNKLFIFWVEITDSTNQDKTKVKKAAIKYTFETLNKKWKQPQTLLDNMMIDVSSNTYSPSGVCLDTEQVFWKKVYPLTIMDKEKNVEKIVVLFGSAVSLPKNLPEEWKIAADNKELNDLNLEIYNSLQNAFQAKLSGMSGYTFILPAAILSSDMLMERKQVFLPNDYSLRSNLIDVINPVSHYDFFSEQAKCWIDDENNQVHKVQNQPDWFTVYNNGEAFISIPVDAKQPVKFCLTDGKFPCIELMTDGSDADSEYTDSEPFEFTRLTTNTISQLSLKVFTGGIDQLLTLESQFIPEQDFARFHAPETIIPPQKQALDYDGPYGLYFKEIFFHIPFLIADILNANQRFSEAQKWYHYIFNPTKAQTIELTDGGEAITSYWRYLPFCKYTPEELIQTLTNSSQIAAYRDAPFDPHAIAQLRMGAYEKAIVMKYIDNILDWADNLFGQNNWESITQATLLYFLAYDLLGPKPEKLYSADIPEVKTFSNIQQKNGTDIPQYLIELENLTSSSSDLSLTETPFQNINSYFRINENEQFVSYWDRVEDRLYKIRHCMNMEGIFSLPSLYEIPINPMQIIHAVSAGNVSISEFSGSSNYVPNYRFHYMLNQAKNLVSTVIQLGNSFLNALEKQDSEQLSLMKASQETAILQLIKSTKEKQIEEAKSSLDALYKSLAGANTRRSHYETLLTNGWNASETNNMKLARAALVLETSAALQNLLAAPVYLLPTIFGLSDGGANPGAALQATSAATSGLSGILNQSASLSATIAQYQRRKEEWQLHLKMAQDDAELIAKQILTAQIHADIANLEMNQHQKSIEQANETETYFQNKFSGKDLYQWIVNRLSILYFQTFKIALEMSLAAQKCYQYELNRDDTYIKFDYWDSLKKGLLAGEGLMLGLNQLEKAYAEGDFRKLEIEKTISLKELNPDAFEKLKADGSCEFELTEKLFDNDFPGHYCRQIKSVSISIPAVVGPYQNIKATLTQTSDRILMKPDIKGVRYLLDEQASLPDTSILRSNWRMSQKIAISKGVNDAGLFELNFREEKYLPFEGTGAISSWLLRMPEENNQSINFSQLTDVIIHLDYTAMDGGDSFGENVKEFLS